MSEPHGIRVDPGLVFRESLLTDEFAEALAVAAERDVSITLGSPSESNRERVESIASDATVIETDLSGVERHSAVWTDDERVPLVGLMRPLPSIAIRSGQLS